MKSSSSPKLSPLRSSIRMKRSGAARPWMESSHGIGRSRQATPASEVAIPSEPAPSTIAAPEIKENPEMNMASDSRVKNPIEAELPNLPFIAKIVSKFGEVYNGFESVGMEHIPAKGPALIVFYHGLVPLDAWYFGLQYYIKTGRLIRGLGDRWLFKTPLLKNLVNAVGAKEGSPKTALDLLKKGELVGVSPGGVREAIAGASKNYQLVWGQREGFARVATEAKVSVIPAFTVNVEEMYRSPFADHPVLQALYEKTRLPLVPIIGLGLLPFPVRLKTFIGEPIPYDPQRSPKELVLETRNALEKLIALHQPRKTSVLKAMKTRFLNRPDSFPVSKSSR